MSYAEPYLRLLQPNLRQRRSAHSTTRELGPRTYVSGPEPAKPAFQTVMPTFQMRPGETTLLGKE